MIKNTILLLAALAFLGLDHALAQGADQMEYGGMGGYAPPQDQGIPAVPPTTTTTTKKPATEKKEEPKLPKSGVLGSFGNAGSGSAKADLPWGGVDTSGEKMAPISGSVSKVTADEWAVKVQNNSKDKYSANVTAQLFGESGGVIKSQSYALSLKPGESTERTIRGGSSAKSGTLLLRNWKKHESKDSKEDAESEEAPKGDGTLE